MAWSLAYVPDCNYSTHSTVCKWETSPFLAGNAGGSPYRMVAGVDDNWRGWIYDGRASRRQACFLSKPLRATECFNASCPLYDPCIHTSYRLLESRVGMMHSYSTSEAIARAAFMHHDIK